MKSDEDFGIYHAGDTALFSDMKLYGELYRPNVGLINVGVPQAHQGAKHGVDQYLTGEMDAQEAALAAEWWGVDYVIPCHHDDPSLLEIVKFKEILKAKQAKDPSAPRPVILKPGETFQMDFIY